MIPVLGYDSGWEIPIETPKPEEGRVINTTSLFRPTSHLPEAMNAVYGHLEDGETLQVISAGCSFGAEVDTVLALHNVFGDGREVNVTGLDYSPEAIGVAQAGEYNSRSIFDFEEPEAKMALLKKLGFEVKLEQLAIGAYLKINAQALREEHQVRFLVHNLFDEVPVETPAHLVLANNVIYHLPKDKQLIAATHLCNALASGGVLSFGSYLRDYETIQTAIENDFGMQWIDHGAFKEKGAYRFRRPLLHR